jgi:hypothetical protein
VSSIVSASDPDGDAIVYYGLYDNTQGSGHIYVNGVLQSTDQFHPLNLTPAQLAQTTFVAGPSGSSDDLFVNAYDGKAWGTTWTEFHVNVPSNTTINHPPTTTAHDVSTTAGQSLAVSSIVAASDPDGDAIVYYGLYDNTQGSGHIYVNGVLQSTDQFHPLNLTPAQLAQTTFVAGPSGSSDDLFVNAYDGKAWGTTWTEFHVNVPTASHQMDSAASQTSLLPQEATPTLAGNTAEALHLDSHFSPGLSAILHDGFLL